MPSYHREATTTTLQIPGSRTVLIDNRIDMADAAETLISFAKRGEAEGYTVISDFVSDDAATRDKTPRLHICTLLRPGKHADLAGVINAMGTLAAVHAIERNSTTRTKIRWLGDIHPEKRRFALSSPPRIATVFSQSLLLPSGFLDYLILHAVIDMPKSRFPLRMVDAVARIFTARPISNADHLTHTFLLDFFPMYDTLFREDGNVLPYRDEYIARSLLLGKRVRFRDGKHRRRGRVVGVSDTGALLILGNRGKRYEIFSQSALL